MAPAPVPAPAPPPTCVLQVRNQNADHPSRLSDEAITNIVFGIFAAVLNVLALYLVVRESYWRHPHSQSADIEMGSSSTAQASPGNRPCAVVYHSDDEYFSCDDDSSPFPPSDGLSNPDTEAPDTKAEETPT